MGRVKSEKTLARDLPGQAIDKRPPAPGSDEISVKAISSHNVSSRWASWNGEFRREFRGWTKLDCVNFCLLNGVGVPKDVRLGAHYYKLAADQGLSVAQDNYGDCLEKGEGVAKGVRLAAEY
jgi:hypothetical protein